uniref:phenylalanine--tRNA ligase n=1 Tax=Astatotilapia calliptera TaxID=8154 RepID=A0AAX7SKD0_ASTCA
MADTGVLETLLQRVEKVDDGVDSLAVATSLGVDHQVIVGAVKSLQALGDVISAELRSSKHWELTEEGTEIAEQGSHESRVFSCIPQEGLAQSELMVESIDDQVREKLLLVQKGHSTQLEEKEKNELKKRKLLSEVTVKSYWITKGNSFSTTITKQETELTPEMIASGNWKEKKFKPYNFEAMGVAPDCGHLHPLMKVRTQFRQIFLEMGFTEMPTNNFIESSFWNFDSLFQPQQHPARDQHDTFFLSDPAHAHEFPQDYLERVKKVHSEGGYGSQGYKYDWKIEEAQKNILRTHTTAVSARMLYKLAQQKFTPVKYFSIDRVFRNETLDATHLAEFHQIEGVVADYGLTLGDLMGVLHQFFTKLGITKLRFKPAYNPYTEPSMEVFSYHEGLKKWVEVGNSGVFRPEMLLPMGLPEDVSVIAWGLSLERPTMIKYGINNIRELVGHKVNLQMVYDSPICRNPPTHF